MYKKAWCTCRVVVLLIKPIVFVRSRCRRRRGFVRSLMTRKRLGWVTFNQLWKKTRSWHWQLAEDKMWLQIKLNQQKKKIDWYTLRRKLDQVDVRKDFWTVTDNREKNWPIAEGRVPSNYPRNICGTRMGSNPLLVSKEANGQFK